MMASVEELYKSFSTLADSKESEEKHAEAFNVLLSGVRGEANAKRLASQFIARFFKNFPAAADSALDALFDLCEDEDVNIRKQAIKDLTSVCRSAPAHLAKVADVLVQLLQTEDAAEHSLVQGALVTLLQVDAKGALNGLFSQILADEGVVREKAVQFLALKLKHVPADMLTADLEAFFLQESKKVLQDVTGDEFCIFMKLLAGLKCMQTLQGRSQLIGLVAEQAEMDKDFEASDPDSVDRLLQCFRQALPHFSKNVHSDKFVAYLVDHVVGSLSSIAQPEEGDVHLDLLKLLAELAPFCGAISEERLLIVFNKMLEYMPLPPSDENGATNGAEPDFSFSYVECLMFAFHELGRRQPSLLTDTEHTDRLKDFRLRLQYFARGVQVYMKQLRAALSDKTGDALLTQENKIRVLALKTVNNINTLIKDLFHNPPSYKAVVTLSWKPVQKQAITPPAPTKASPGDKRASGGADSGLARKKSHQDRQTYAPPQGKFSNKAGDYPAFRGGRGRGRGGGMRGGRGGRGRGGRGGRRW